MSAVDWGILGAVSLSVLLAAASGFIFELFSLAGVVLGYLFAAWGYHRVAAWYVSLAKTPAIADIAGFLTIFFAVVLLAGIVARIARWATTQAGLRWFDRLLGGAFGLVRGALLVTIVLMATASFVPRAEWLAESQIAPYMLVVARAALWAVPSDLRVRFHQGVTTLHDAQMARDKQSTATIK